MVDPAKKAQYFRINTDKEETYDVKIILECYRKLYDGDRLVSKSGKTYEYVAITDDDEYVLMDCSNGSHKAYTALMMKDMEVL
jgi:hypothetical protein